MRLFYTPSTISVAVAITLEEAGLDYTHTLIDFAQAEQTKPDYLAINPKGRVPALETEGTILTETGALLDYIAAKAPGANFIPNDPIKAAQMRSVMYYLASTMHINHAHGPRGSRWADHQSSFDDMKKKVPETMAASAQYIEDSCLKGPYILGDELTLADPYLFAIGTWLPGDGVTVSDFPKLAAFMDTMRARTSVKTVITKGILPR